MEIVNIKDALWTKLQVESDTRDVAWNELSIANLANICLAAHLVVPVQKVVLHHNDPTSLTLDFLDGRTWRIVFIERDVDGRVTYDLGDTSWNRSTIFQYISPITNIVHNMWVLQQIDRIDIRPR